PMCRLLRLRKYPSFRIPLFCSLHFNCRDYSEVRSATTDVAVHVTNDLLTGRLSVLVEQSHARQDHSGSTIAALHSVSFQKRVLHWMQTAVFLQTLDCRYLAISNATALGYTGTGLLSIDQHGACATLRFTATVLRTCEVQVIAENAQQTRLRIDIDS